MYTTKNGFHWHLFFCVTSKYRKRSFDTSGDKPSVRGGLEHPLTHFHNIHQVSYQPSLPGNKLFIIEKINNDGFSYL